jgi:hypothetical protein
MSDPQNQAPLPLDYRPPRDEPTDLHFVAHAVGGSILTAVALVAIVFGTILLCLASNSGAAWIPCGLITVAALIGLSIVLYRNPRRRGWAVGLWLGVGLAALVEGACFFAVNRGF